ncbi:MAG TPA: DNRLRE domain-containing protein [Candidatus Krumholzibacteria bacterium]|nr:DNRLRE domain-containing protein [Candidatus Krumholzibacteria bacterium]
MTSRRRATALLLLLVLVAWWVACGDDDPVEPDNGAPAHRSEEITASKDNTLYEEDGLCDACPGTNGVLDSLSNGAGEWVFAGTNNLGRARRALVAFDVAGNIPAGAVVDSVVLTLTMSRTIAGTHTVALHRVLADWGEGTSDASCCAPEEGTGGTATVGDATWVLRVFRAAAWTTPGGDFAVASSSVRSVAGSGPYQWQSAQMTSDVQAWLDAPATNFGWILIGDETVDRSAKRFDSRESAATAPRLTVYYTVP